MDSSSSRDLTRSGSSSPIVTVIIPTFNRLTMLKEAIASVHHQTLHPLELIVVDDGSSDGTWTWLQRQTRLIALHRRRRGGPSVARNTGAARSRSPYLAFLDSDDLFQPTKLEQQISLLDQRPELALCHCNEVWLRSGKELKQKKKHEKKGGEIFEHCLPMCRISPSAAVIRRDVFQQLGGFDETLEIAEDYDLWLRLTAQHTVGFIDQALTIKRGGHEDQLSMKYGQIEIFRIQALQKLLQRDLLSEVQRSSALSTLEEKCRIYAMGCQKRGRPEEAHFYQELPKVIQRGEIK